MFARTALRSWLSTDRTPPARRPRRFAVEQLEAREVPATFTVTTVVDTGPGSLRWAIDAANAAVNSAAGPDVIQFAIGSGVQTIAPAAATLPPITDPVVIDGTTQPGYAGTPLIELNGTGAGAGANGLTITAGSSTVRGLVINRFGQNGIYLSVGSGNVITGCYIGTDVSGMVGAGNGLSGIRVESAFNTVGGLAGIPGTGAGNVISGNKGSVSGNLNSAGGISISNANGNLVEGNLVGTNASGTGALANAGFGVILVGSSAANVLGGDAVGARNVISGNARSGIGIALGGSGNSVEGNYVGTDVSGTFAIGNKSNGILVTQGSNTNTISGNVISGNNFALVGGVNIISSSNNVVEGNYFGTDHTGATSTGSDGVTLGNSVGVAIQANPGLFSSGNVIGGVSAAARNIVAGSLQAGVWLSGDGVQGNLVTGNVISGNSGNGVQLIPFTGNVGGGSRNTITSNVISGNTLNGVLLGGNSTIRNQLTGNRIYANGGLGIDLGGDGVTLNDGDDADAGPNNLQNFPVLTTAATGSNLLASGTLHSTAGTTFTIDVYASPTADPSGYGEGQYYLGSMTVHTDGAGNASFTTLFPTAALPGGVVPAGWAISATATDSDGNTSEFSADLTAIPSTVTVAGPAVAVVGQGLTFTLTPSDPTPADQAGTFSYAIDWDGDGTPDQTVSGPAGATVAHTFATAGSYSVRVQATDQDGLLSPASPPLAVAVADVTSTAVQNVVSNPLPVDPATGHPTVTIQGDTQAQANAVAALFQPPGTPGFAPLQPPPGATTPIDIVFTAGSAVQFDEAKLAIPAGIRLQINGGTWIGGSPALTFSSGDLTVTGATFVNATNAPTVLVTGGRLTLRNCMIQESTGYDQAAVQVDGGVIDLGTAADPGGNTLNVNGPGGFVRNATATPIPAVGDAFTADGAPLRPSTLSGVVWEDFNGDGQVDFGEGGIGGATVTLTGTDDLGNPVSRTQATDASGAYLFLGLRPGTYRVTEAQPAGYLQGRDAVGTAGGSIVAADQFAVPLGVQVDGLNYNFGELPAATGPVQRGQTAGIGFWNNRNGQALIRALNGGTGHQLADWLAATLPNTFGVTAGAADLAGRSNAYVAALFQQDFLLTGVKLDAQVLATALSVYATNAALDPTRVAAQYGFTVAGDGAGASAVNVGTSGDAFGVANGTTLTLMQLLLATDALSVNGVLYGGNLARRRAANDVYTAVNQAGGL